MGRTMTYEKDLAFNLRIRGMSESQIVEVISEVRAHAANGVSAESEFGSPEEYASSFPKGKRRTRGARVIAMAVIVAIAYGVAVLVLAVVFHVDIRAITGPVTVWPALLIVVLGILLGFLIDYLRPPPRSDRA